jgi:hypothetical protein
MNISFWVFVLFFREVVQLFACFLCLLIYYSCKFFFEYIYFLGGGFEAFAAGDVFWVVTLCGLVGRYLPTNPHRITTQKTNVYFFVC